MATAPATARAHDTAHYMEITERCGYRPVWFKDEAAARANARLAYCREHEVCHHIVAEWIMGTESRVLWPLAHGFEPDQAEAIAEEALTMTFQRWLRAGERPLIGGADWDKLKAKALELLDA